MGVGTAARGLAADRPAGQADPDGGLFMSVLGTIAAATAAGAVAAGIGLGVGIKRRSMDRWLPDYIATAGRRRMPPPDRDIHAIICVADHYEPLAGEVDDARARARVDAWVDRYPRLFDRFRDSDGRPPRHSFFFPIEMYVPEHLDGLAELCGRGFGEVEIHLHHDHDTSENLRRRLVEAKRVFSERHGLLSRDPATGEVVYGFIHGNWALDNARPDGRWCGVNDELDILRETGCYADFTLPSAPSATQPRTINSIYYAVDDPRKPKSHDRGQLIGSGPQPDRSLMIVQGPLILDWKRRKFGLIPFVENSCIPGQPGPDRAPARPLAQGPGAGARPAGLVLHQAAHPRRAGVEPGGAAGRPDGSVPRRPRTPRRRGSPVPLPLRDCPRDVQPHPGRGVGRGRDLGRGRPGILARIEHHRGRGSRTCRCLGNFT